MATQTNTEHDLEIIASDVPTYFVDGAVGSAFAGAVHRILMAEFVVDASPGASLPGVRHTVSLAIPTAAVPAFIKFLQEMPGFAPDEG